MASSSTGGPSIVDPQPALIGYLAHRLRTGEIRCLSTVIPSVTPPSPEDMERLRNAVLPLLPNFLRGIRQKSSESDSTDATVRGLLRALYVHTQTVDSKLKEDIIKILPILTRRINDLIARPPFRPFGREDAKALALAIWFKESFMKWVDPVMCDNCESPCNRRESAEPYPFEKARAAGRVETYVCREEGCGGGARFPRYNDPAMLLQTRTGRCGEFANLFYQVLRAAGLNARYVWNSEDHVWNEYWSPTLGHWVHVDSCEGTTNKPLLYARGWGKKQAFCFALAEQGAEDVTRYYVDDWDDCQTRRRAKGWRESFLAQSLAEITVRKYLGQSIEKIREMEAREASHAAWVENEAKRWTEAEAADLRGRESGTEEWRAQRDELGDQQAEPVPEYTVKRKITKDKWDFQYIALGDAIASRDETRLSWRGGQTSALFYPEPLPQNISFLAQLTFRMIAPPNAPGADGMALAFLSEPVLGEGGYGLGYSQRDPRDGDFAVEVDTFQSWDYAADPEVPHISVHSPPNAHHRYSITCTRPGTLPTLNDGQVLTLKLLFDARTRRLWGWLVLEDDTELCLWQTTIPNRDVNIDGPDGDTAANTGEDERVWHVGITGATGGLYQTQEVWTLDIEEVDFGEPVDGEAQSPANVLPAEDAS